MTDHAQSRRFAFPSFGYLAPLGAAVLAVAAVRRPPRLELILAADPAVQIHLAGALVAFVLGGVLLLGPKGTLPHRTLGWIWAAAMGITAVSSLFIREINPGAFSLIHALSGWVIVALPGALYAARTHRVRLHRRGMTGLYVGGLFVAGGFAFVPGRLMYLVFFG